MKEFIGKAGIGKTRELVEEAAKNNGIIVCECPERIREKATAYGCYGVEIISFTEFIAFDTDPTRKYYVKDATALLEAMGIDGFTITTD